MHFQRFELPVADERNQNIVPQYPADDAYWVWHPQHLSADEDSVMEFTLDVELLQEIKTDCFISADNRFEFFCDGERIGMGPDRCDKDHWAFSAYHTTLSAGRHTLRVSAWYFHKFMPDAQIMIRPGFMFTVNSPELQKIFNTGLADWKVRSVNGCRILQGFIIVGGSFEYDLSAPREEAVSPAVIRKPVEINYYGQKAPYWRLCPSNLPEQVYKKYRKPVKVCAVIHAPFPDIIQIPMEPSAEIPDWQKLFDEPGSITIPANQTVQVLVDLTDYVCAYPRLRFSGGQGGSIRVIWREALHIDPKKEKLKGNRNEYAGKYFANRRLTDSFIHLDGKEHDVSTFWWRPGRYILYSIETKSETLTLQTPELFESYYPMEKESEITFDNPDMQRVQPMLFRVLQMCSHEIFMDCPGYEQQMYVVDTRLAMLASYTFHQDPRLVLRGLRIFEWSRSVWHGLVAENFPTRVDQLSGLYTALWPLLIEDYVMYRKFDSDKTFLKQRRAVRAMLMNFQDYVNEEGLIENLPGWSFLDWVNEKNWNNGVPPPGTDKGKSAIYTLFYLMLLKSLIRMERNILPDLGFGIADYCQCCFDRTVSALKKTFWDEDKSLFSDDPGHTCYSIHTQCFALLSDAVTGEDARRCYNAMLTDKEIAWPTLYFIHYLFEVFHKFGEGCRILDYLHIWTDMCDLGAVTSWETPEPTRSDCHGWGAHLYYHYFASIVGIRPASPCFRSVMVEPSFGPLKSVKGKLPHPDGMISFELKKGADSSIHGIIELPEGCTGIYRNNGIVQNLSSGMNVV